MSRSADSRHQACLVSDRRTRMPRSRQASLRAPGRPPGSIGVISRGIYFPLTTKRQCDERSAAGDRRFAGTILVHRLVIEPPLLIVVAILEAV